MTVQHSRGLALVFAGLGLVVIGLMMSRVDQPLFGISSDFGAGFLLGIGLVSSLAGVAALVTPRN